jgi:ATP-binding cassette, subfamily C, bacteriocin exporter
LPKPPYFRQAHPFSCVPACLKMVLASYNREISETELRSRCDCDETGTTPSNTIKAAIEYGFSAYQAELIIKELQDLVSQNITPIVFIRASEGNYSHAVVVYKILKEKIFVLDPEIGEREIDINSFAEIWSRGLTIVIEKKTH